MLSSLAQEKIGIWGYGTTGKAAVRWCLRSGYTQLHLYDQKPLSSSDQVFCRNAGIALYAPDQLEQFLKATTVLMPSPGIPLSKYMLRHAIITELSIFIPAWHGKTVGITGTIGKTTVTTLLSHAVRAAQGSVATGGNIGTPLLDLLEEKHTPGTTAVIELSSFQLEHEQNYSPDLAIITNLYPNHLDRHQTLEAYRTAKQKIYTFQKLPQQALLPLSLAPTLAAQAQLPPAGRAWFSLNPEEIERSELTRNDRHYTIIDDQIVRTENNQHIIVAPLPHLRTTFPENLLIIYAAADLLDIALPPDLWQTATLPAHRLAPLGCWNGVTFYNDSKATVPEATIAAARTLNPQHLVIFIGGISKGVDRQPLIQTLAPLARHIICFGAEATQLATWCTAAAVPSTSAATLEEAFERYTQEILQPGDQVLFSPSGASYDLFAHYEERGERFMTLVSRWAEQKQI